MIEEANDSGHKGQPYIIWVTKKDRLISQNVKHICSSPVTTEQYLYKYIK